MSAPALQRLASLIGNKRTAMALVRTSPKLYLQRVPVSYADQGETLYENPNMAPGAVPIAAPTAAQKQFTATPYSQGTINYDIDRTPSDVTVTVRIQFIDQKRGENQFLKDATGAFVVVGGQKQPDPQFGQDVGPISAITDPERQKFAQARCEAVTKAWNHYDLQSKTIPKAPAAAPGGVPSADGGVAAPAEAPKEVKLPVKFVAQPVFDLAAKNVHSKIRLFSAATEANRAGAHPIDSGHWYLNSATNYAGMDVDAIAAHEYGHLIGLQDEYFRSDDQAHQLIHRMGGGAKNSDKALDQHTLRQMVTLALFQPLNARVATNVDKVATTLLSSKEMLRKQLVGAVRTTWADAALRESMVKQIHPALKTAGLKRSLRSVVDFETTQNMPNLTRASEGMSEFTGAHIATTVLGGMSKWQSDVMGQGFTTTGGDGSSVTITSEYSQNVSQHATTGAGAAQGTALADSVIGGGAAPAALSKIAPSATLLGQLDALPAQWKEPGKGLGAAYNAGVVTPQMQAVIDTAIATGLIPKIKSVGELYVRVLKLVTSTSQASAKGAVRKFVEDSILPKVNDQMKALSVHINAEVDTALGMPAGALAAKAGPDPNVKAVASQLHGLLKSQQNKASYDQKADLNPGAGAAGGDVRHTASTLMGTNVTDKSGARSDMIQPVVDQFNAKLKQPDEENFTAKTR